MRNKFSFPHYRQLDAMDCGPTCLKIIAKYYGRSYTSQTLRDKAQINKDGVSMLGIAEAAEGIGFKTVGAKLDLQKLITDVPLPCILHWKQNHFVVLYKIQKSWLISGKDFLHDIIGGKKTSILTGTVIEDNVEKFKSSRGLTKGQYEDYMFHISDPFLGLVSYSSDEIESHWLSQAYNGKEYGVALLLEPVAKFYEEEGEGSKPLHLSHLLGHINKYKDLVIQLVLGMLLGSGLQLILPFLTQSVIDIGIGTQNLPFIYLVLSGQLVLILSSTLVDFIRSWILLHISSRLSLTILSDFLSKIMRLPSVFFDSKHFGDIMQRIDDQHRIESFLTGSTLNLIFSIFNVFIFGLVLIYYNVNIFMLAIGSSIVYAIWVALFLKKRKRLDGRRFEIAARNQSQIVQLIHGMQDIKIAGAETSKRWEWESTQAKLFKWNIRTLSLNQTQQAGAVLINQSKNVLITLLAAKAVLEGQLTLGAMMSVLYILGQFNAPVEQLIGFTQSWQDAQISLERLNEVHALNDEEPSGTELRKTWEKKSDIYLSNVTFTYPGAGNQPSLKDVTLKIPFGKTTAIVGTSGSGKTTLLKLLLRFHDPDSGKITVSPNCFESMAFFEDKNPNKDLTVNATLKYENPSKGHDIKLISHSAWRKQCGVVMQDGFIFSDTIARNIAVSDDPIDQERLFEAGKIANIHSFVESLPLGYHTKIGAEGNGISQGQKQRILIARAIYKNPNLLILDEATNSLDANNEAIILKNLNQYLGNRTVIVVAHRLSTVRDATQIIVLENGEIIEQGNHAELLIRKGKYYELVSNQLELALT